MKSLKIKSYPGENVTYFCAEILLDADPLKSDGAFKSDHLGYITHIFEDTSDYRYRLWEIHKYKEVTEFIKKRRVCDMNVISIEELITYKSRCRISTTVILITYKQGWIYGRGWMWFQWSVEHFLRNFTWRCGSFSLLLGLSSSGIMWCGVLLLC